MSTSIVHSYVVHGAAPVEGTRKGKSAPARGFLRGLLVTARVWQERVTLRRHLARLDDRLLRDVGLDRRQAVEEAAKPFWKR